MESRPNQPELPLGPGHDPASGPQAAWPFQDQMLGWVSQSPSVQQEVIVSLFSSGFISSYNRDSTDSWGWGWSRKAKLVRLCQFITWIIAASHPLWWSWTWPFLRGLPCQTSLTLSPPLAPQKPMVIFFTHTSLNLGVLTLQTHLIPAERQIHYKDEDFMTFFSPCPFPPLCDYFPSPGFYLHLFEAFLWKALGKFVAVSGSMWMWGICWDLLSSSGLL